jgi:SAM-dependent methyltransferase
MWDALASLPPCPVCGGASAPADPRQVDWNGGWRGMHAQDLPWAEPEEAMLAFLRRVAPRPCAVLEAGSGSGHVTARLAALGYPVTLLDRSPEALRVAGECLAAVGAQGTTLQVDFLTAERDGFVRDAGFDLVWSGGVLEHFPQPEQVAWLQACARACRPGGAVVQFVPYAGCVTYRLARAFLEAQRAWPYGDERPVDSLAHVSHESVPALAFQFEETISAEAGWRMFGTDPRVGRLREALDALLPRQDQTRILGCGLLAACWRRVGS